MDARHNRSLISGFLRSAMTYPNRPALEVDGEVLDYATLLRFAASIAAVIAKEAPAVGPPLTAVLAHRSQTAFGGVLGGLIHGHGYVPLNRTFPVERSRAMLERSQARVVIVDEGSEYQLASILQGRSERFLLIFPEHRAAVGLAARYPGHSVVTADELPATPPGPEPACDPQAISYLLFTSGSTGVPKGVGVTHANVLAFLDGALSRYDIAPTDRFSQTFEMTFDLSVFDMFMAWERGACVCCLPQKALLNPGRFIRENQLTVWFSVPSLASIMRKLGALKPERYPSLRWSLFCGEPLPTELADSWAAAAPASIVENLYGPTEATIACTVFRWLGSTGVDRPEMGVVPIGQPLPGMRCLVVDESLREVAPGEAGELLMSGPQITPGYWQDPELSRRSYVVPPGCEEIHYRTGDRVRRPEGDAPLAYLGRIDHQVKVYGHRVELGEIESVLRREAGIDAAIAVGWPVSESGAAGVEAFLGSVDVDIPSLTQRLKLTLPEYMVPRRIHLFEKLPLNSNGKYDRIWLLNWLKESS